MIKYFHELTKEEFDKLLKEKITWGECAKRYPQPKWCAYPEAIQGAMGCWSLMDVVDESPIGIKISRKYCRKCDCYRSRPKKEKK